MHTTKLTKREFKAKMYSRRYVVPNAVTVGNMFCGFLAIIYSATGRYEKAVIAILMALLLDGLDGRVARKLNATSKFGLEFDSLSDLISFGIAPAMMMYFWCFQKTADEFGVLFCFIYAVCAASRLARFNISAQNLKSFTGLPSPAAAGMITALVNLNPHLQPSYLMTMLGAMYLLFAGYLMISTVEFISIKKLKFSTIAPHARMIAASVIVLIWYDNRIGLYALATVYAISGPWKSCFGKTVPASRLSPQGESHEYDFEPPSAPPTH